MTGNQGHLARVGAPKCSCLCGSRSCDLLDEIWHEHAFGMAVTVKQVERATPRGRRQHPKMPCGAYDVVSDAVEATT